VFWRGGEKQVGSNKHDCAGTRTKYTQLQWRTELIFRHYPYFIAELSLIIMTHIF
jgi:hypothetical protein